MGIFFFDNKKTASIHLSILLITALTEPLNFILPSLIKTDAERALFYYINFILVENLLNTNNNHYACQGFLKLYCKITQV